MGDTGLEPWPETSGKTSVSTEGGAESGAVGARKATIDPDLQAVIDAWPTLSEVTRAHVLEVIREHQGDS